MPRATIGFHSDPSSVKTRRQIAASSLEIGRRQRVQFRPFQNSIYRNGNDGRVVFWPFRSFPLVFAALPAEMFLQRRAQAARFSEPLAEPLDVAAYVTTIISELKWGLISFGAGGGER